MIFTEKSFFHRNRKQEWIESVMINLPISYTGLQRDIPIIDKYSRKNVVSVVFFSSS